MPMLNVMLEKKVLEEFAIAMRQLAGTKENGKHQCATKEIVTRDNHMRNAEERTMAIRSAMELSAGIKKDTLNALHRVKIIFLCIFLDSYFKVMIHSFLI